ncbi:MAG TPA: hypothetical protein VF669_23415 [Tepidisphaeraceae bacterium]
MKAVSVHLVAVIALAFSTCAYAAAKVADESDALKAPRAMLAAAQQEVDQTQRELNAAIDKAKADFEKSSECTDAQSTLKQAQADRDAAVQPILKLVRERDDYKAALEAQKQAAAEVDRLRSSGASSADITAAARKSADASAAVDKLETDAISADDNAKAASKRVTEAGAALAQIRQKLNETVRRSADVQQATQKLDAAKTKRAKAQAALDDQIRREEKLRQEREKQRNKSRRRR